MGKGNEAGELELSTRLYDVILAEFQGEVWLFEHDGRQYNPNSVSDRVKRLSEQILGKSCTAHSIRHAVGQRYTDLYGIGVAAEKLRHRSIDTTRDYYAKVWITEEQFEKAAGLESQNEEEESVPSGVADV